jgi:L-aminopeptidase/D-esterase-like protein
LGAASVDLGGGLLVAALVAVNAFGDVVDPQTGHILAGARRADGAGFADTLAVLRERAGEPMLRFGAPVPVPGNTVIGVVVTSADLTKEGANKVAQMAHDGIARVVRPAHTMFDGDTLFALATGQVQADVNVVGAFAAEVVAQAIVRGVMAATPAGGLPAHTSLSGEGGKFN